MRRVVFVLALALALAGCDSCHTSKSAAPDVHVMVERPNKAVFMLDGSVLAKHAPDLSDPPWQAWKLENVVPEWDDRAPVDVIDEEGIRSPLLRPGEPASDLESVLIVGLGGESRVVRLAPGASITAHRGESRKDAGRIRHVTKLVGSNGSIAGPDVSLKVLIHGEEKTWTRAELMKVPPIVLMSKDGDGERDAWPLRALAKTLVGEAAIPSEVLGDEPKTMRVDAAKWNDASLEPVLRSNRRGRLKFVWLDAKTHEEDEDEPHQKGVRELRFP